MLGRGRGAGRWHGAWLAGARGIDDTITMDCGLISELCDQWGTQLRSQSPSLEGCEGAGGRGDVLLEGDLRLQRNTLGVGIVRVLRHGITASDQLRGRKPSE